MTERERMEKIKSEWGAFILRAVAGTPVPEALVAALVANESGGADGSKRFEPEVYGHLVRVQVGMETYYGSLKRADLRNLSDEALRGLATSWGPTQIMGYNAIAHGVDYLALDTPPVSMELTVKIILDDARRFRLDPSKDFGALLKCWNTGGPSGKTFDPLYVLKGMQRLRLYAEV